MYSRHFFLQLEMNSRSVVKQKEDLYRAIISQLLYDNHHEQALSLIQVVMPNPECPPSGRLFHLFQKGLQSELLDKSEEEKALGGTASNPNDPSSLTVSSAAGGIDLEYESDVLIMTPEAVNYDTVYVTSHKDPCKTTGFSYDGQFAATGSVDASIKLLDVDKMLIKGTTDAANESADQHPVIKTYYDHVNEITCIKFHPFDTFMASGAKDKMVKVYDYSKTASKKAVRTIEDVEPIKDVSYHPSGEWLLVSCRHPVVRLYNIETGSCFVAANPKEHHSKFVNTVDYAHNGRLYATGGKDGSVKIWDGVSSRCIQDIPSAHGGESICSVRFSKNSRYLLTAGKDSLVKLWEIGMSRDILTYTGAGSQKMTKRVPAVFNHTEDYVFFPDEGATSLCCWSSRNGERMRLLPLVHTRSVRFLAHSPVHAGMMTCGDDFRARFWYAKPLDS